MTTSNEKDGKGRFPGAPAWDGDLETASAKALDEHETGLMVMIANITVVYTGYKMPVEPWQVATQAQLHAEGFERWVDRLVQVRTEQERRKQVA